MTHADTHLLLSVLERPTVGMHSCHDEKYVTARPLIHRCLFAAPFFNMLLSVTIRPNLYATPFNSVKQQF